MKRARPKNPELIEMIRLLRKKSTETGAPIWGDMADRLLRTRRRRITVNLSRLNRHSQKGDVVAVPGKVLGAGKLDHPVQVAAFSFSELARSKILKARGKCLSLVDLMEHHPEGSHVKIMG